MNQGNIKEPLEQRVAISVNNLLLDQQNPRLELPESQRSIINHLLENENAFELAKDIAEKGELNPLDNIGVIQEDSSYIVLEGNRRCAALKALNNPELVDSVTTKRRIQKAISEFEFDSINEIECVKFESREDANEFIRIRHGGEAGGVGTKRWNATQNENFRTRNNYRPLYKLATELMDWAEQNEVIPKITRKELSITNIERMVKSPVVKSKMGIRVDSDGEILSSHNFSWLAGFISELVRRERLPNNDLNRINANNAYSSGDRQRIANEIVTTIRAQGFNDDHLQQEVKLSELKAKTYQAEPSDNTASDYDTDSSESEPESSYSEASGQPESGEGWSDPDDNSEGEEPETNGSKSEEDASPDSKPEDRPGYVPDISRRTKLFSKDFKVVINDRVLAKLVTEMRKIDVREFNVSTLFLVRAFLEGVFGNFCKEYKLDNGNPQLELRKKIERTCDYLLNSNNGHDSDAKRTANALKTLKTISSDDSKILSPNRINNVVHGGTHAPSHSEIIQAWEGIEKEVKFVLKVLWPYKK